MGREAPFKVGREGRSSGTARCQQHTGGVVHFAGVQRPDPDCCRPRTARRCLVLLPAAATQQPRFPPVLQTTSRNTIRHRTRHAAGAEMG
jgi:hypothetical protein